MARHPFSSSPSYLRNIRGLRELHALTLAGFDESPEADAVRDSLEGPWYDLSEIERQRLKGLSADLYSISDPIEQPLPSNPQVQRKLRESYEANQLGKWDQALDLLRRWGRHVDPALLSFLRGTIWQAAGDNETAVLFFEHASRLDPQSYKTIYLWTLGCTDPDAARKLAQEILESEEENTPNDVATASGILFDAARNQPLLETRALFERLIPALERAWKRTTSVEPAFPTLDDESRERIALLLAGCRERLGDSRAAIRHLNEAMASDPGNPSLLVFRGIFRYGREAGAIDDFRQAIQLGNRDVWPDFYLAHDAFIAGRFDDCLAHCERALTFPAPDEVRASLHEWLAIARAERRFPPDLVRSAFEEAVRLAPDSDQIRKNLAAFEQSPDTSVGPRADWVKPRALTVQAFGRPVSLLSLLPFPSAA